MFFVNYKQSLILLLKKQWNEPFNHTFIIFRIPKSETQKKKLRKKTVCQNIWNIQWLSKSYPSSSFFLENLPKKFEPFLFISDFCLLSFHLIDLFWSLLVLFYFGQVFFQFFPFPFSIRFRHLSVPPRVVNPILCQVSCWNGSWKEIGWASHCAHSDETMTGH